MSFALAQYRSARIETASPLQLLVQLYDGAIRFLRQGEAAAKANRPGDRGAALGRAHAIIVELQATLEPKHAPELCAQLDALYDFVVHQITEANRRNDASPIVPAIRVLTDIRSAYATLAEGQK
jgi:flagellar protein FliS